MTPFEQALADRDFGAAVDAARRMIESEGGRPDFVLTSPRNWRRMRKEHGSFKVQQRIARQDRRQRRGKTFDRAGRKL